jgi:hypothetical protein
MKNINNIFKFPYKIAHTQKRERRPNLKEIGNILPCDNFEMNQPKKISKSPSPDVINLAPTTLKNNTLSPSSIQKTI